MFVKLISFNFFDLNFNLYIYFTIRLTLLHTYVRNECVGGTETLDDIIINQGKRECRRGCVKWLRSGVNRIARCQNSPDNALGYPLIILASWLRFLLFIRERSISQPPTVNSSTTTAIRNASQLCSPECCSFKKN